MTSKNDIHRRLSAAPSLEQGVAALESELKAIANEDEREESFLILAECLSEDWALDAAERLGRSCSSEDWLSEKGTLYGKIAGQFAKLGRKTEGLRLLQKAVPLVRTEHIEWLQAEKLEDLAEHLFALGERSSALQLLDDAITTAKRGEDKNDIDASSVLCGIAQDLALAGEFGRAHEVAIAIKNEWKRKRAVTRVSRMRSFAPHESPV